MHPTDAVPTLRTIAMPADTNPAGDIFGGWLLGQMDLAGAAAAMRRSKSRCATVAVEAMQFLKPVFVGDEVTLYTEIVAVGRTSIRVAVDAWRRSRDGEEVEQVTKGVFTFVAIDDERKPRPVDRE